MKRTTGSPPVVLTLAVCFLSLLNLVPVAGVEHCSSGSNMTGCFLSMAPCTQRAEINHAFKIVAQDDHARESVVAIDVSYVLDSDGWTPGSQPYIAGAAQPHTAGVLAQYSPHQLWSVTQGGGSITLHSGPKQLPPTCLTADSTGHGASVFMRRCGRGLQQWSYDDSAGTLAVQGGVDGPSRCLSLTPPLIDQGYSRISADHEGALARAPPYSPAGSSWAWLEYALLAIFLCAVVCASWCVYVRRSMPPSEYVEIQAMGMHDTLSSDATACMEPPPSP